MKTSLTEKMILYFLALGMGGIVITGLFSFYSAREALLERSYNQLTSIRLTRKAAIERFFADRMRETAFLASSGDCSITRLPSSAYYSGSILFDSNSSFVNDENLANDNLPGLVDCRGIKSSEHGIPALDGIVAVSRIMQSEKYLGLIIKSASIDSIMLEVNPRHGLGYSGETYLTGNDLVMRTSSRFIKNSVMRTRVFTLPALRAVSGEEGVMIASDYRGIRVLSSYGSINIGGLKWVILAEIDYAEATASVNAIRDNIIWMSLLTAVALFVLTYVVSRNITRPLKKLKLAAAGISRGDTGMKLPVESNDEIGDLTEAFNLMALDLQVKEEALKAERMMRVSSAIDGQDKERQRLSRELHDGIGQTIIGIRLRMAALENDIPEKIKDAWYSLLRINDNLIDDVRAASNALMPPALAEFGLMPAVKSVANLISDATGINIDVKGEFPESLFGRKPTLYIFRIIQEALNNAARHSGGTNIEVRVRIDNGSLSLSVTDDGKGFDPGLACMGHGLLNIKDRVSLLKGQLSIMPVNGGGTAVCVEIPVNKVQYDKIIAG